MGVNRTALIQVLGAVAYGELKAYEGAKEQARTASTDDERRVWKTQAAEELRHHRGFVKRLEALGADPERAMRPYRRALDSYHSDEPHDDIAAAIWDYLGEGVADDLLGWLRLVVDEETAEFIETVAADEVNHEARAAAGIRGRLHTPADHREAMLATMRMVGRMLASGAPDPRPFLAFVRLGRTPELLGALVGGQIRRLQSIGLRPLGVGVAA